jgi:hypothetical protein
MKIHIPSGNPGKVCLQLLRASSAGLHETDFGVDSSEKMSKIESIYFIMVRKFYIETRKKAIIERATAAVEFHPFLEPI